MKIRKMKILTCLLRVSFFVRKLNVNIRTPCIDYNVNYKFSLTYQSGKNNFLQLFQLQLCMTYFELLQEDTN